MSIRKLFSCLIIILVVAASCKKSSNACGYTESTYIAPAAEVDSLQEILTDSGIVATRDTSGFFYKINQQGTGTAITSLCSAISVNYEGSFFGGKVFDSSAKVLPAIFSLGQAILGWQKGLPLITKGGNLTLYIPPSLAYGSSPYPNNGGPVVIPPNSYLIFNISLVDAQ